MPWTVGELARQAGLTVRTLHHWDEVGLLRPSGRSPAGYRLYEPDDLSRLQAVCGYRALGFGLREVQRLLDDPDVDPLDHLRRQHALLVDRAAHLTEVAAAVRHALEARRAGIELTPGELREVVGDEDPTQHAEEAEQRWGDTDDHRTSLRRISSSHEARCPTSGSPRTTTGGHPAWRRTSPPLSTPPPTPSRTGPSVRA